MFPSVLESFDINHPFSSRATASLLVYQLLADPIPLAPRRFNVPSAAEAYRFSGEMDSIADFVGGTKGAVYSGFAAEYEQSPSG